MKVREATTVSCYHCGDPCVDDHRVRDGMHFCCQGCEAVYELLNESGLCDYYALEEQPGVRQRAAVGELRTELFDLPEVRSRLVEVSEDGISRARFHVPQMHCSSCIWLLENLARIEPAILRSRVSFGHKELTITFREERISLGGVVKLLRRIGYGPQLDGVGGAKDGPVIPRMLYIRLGVAGFVFGNTMMFSFPEYLGAEGVGPGIRAGFQWLCVLFSLPIVFFAGTDFFRGAWAGLRLRQVNIDQPIALGITALWLRSIGDVLSGAGPGYFDSLAGLVFFLLIGRWYQAYTYRSLRFDRVLEDFLPLVVLRKVMDGEAPVKVNDLKPGDRIIVRDQELVPVDSILREGTAHIDNSFITGEPQPVRRGIGDTVKAGGRQRGAAIELEVLRSFAESRLKRLWAEQESGQARPGMSRLIDAVARRFTIAVLLISLMAGLYWWGRDPAQVWTVVTAVLIVACPCALALSMPFAYGHTIRLLGKHGLFLRDATVVERMARIDTVVFDKTGTLTEREAHRVTWHGPILDAQERQLVRSLARSSTHPLSTVLVKELKGDTLTAIEVEEVAGEGISGLIARRAVRIGSAEFCGGVDRMREPGEASVHVTIDGLHKGSFAIRKQARAGIAGAVRGLRTRMDVALLTGDASVDPELQRAFAGSNVRAGCSPTDKSRFVRELQDRKNRVLMIGDGLNDAAALARSDVGISVTETSAALTPASDAIMDAGSVTRIAEFLRMARRARRIVIASLAISLCYNITGVSFAVSGQLTPLIAAILMPLSSVTVVGFVTLAVTLAARSGSGVQDSN